MTNVETPRLLSEYLAARAQSAGCKSPNAIVDPAASAKIDNVRNLIVSSAARDGGSYNVVCAAGSLGAGGAGRGATGR